MKIFTFLIKPEKLVEFHCLNLDQLYLLFELSKRLFITLFLYFIEPLHIIKCYYCISGSGGFNFRCNVSIYILVSSFPPL